MDGEGKWFGLLMAVSLLLSTLFLGVVMWAIISLVGWVVTQ